MMPIKWKLFRVAVIIQMLASSVLAIMAMISFVTAANFYTLIVVILFVLVFLQTILAISILNNNYPDIPVAGNQKDNFNRLFLLNFLFLLFLFGIIFAEYRELQSISSFTGR